MADLLHFFLTDRPIYLGLQLNFKIHIPIYLTVKSLILTLLLVGCERDHDNGKPFGIVIIQDPQSKEERKPFEFDSLLSPALSYFVGVYATGDTVNVPDTIFHNLFGGQYLKKELFDRTLANHSFQSNGLTLTPLENKIIWQREYGINTDLQPYIPILISNMGQDTAEFFGNGRKIPALQEALDSNGHWHPISTGNVNTCMDQIWVGKIPPGNHVLITIPRFQGKFSTQIRTRIKIGQNTYVSPSYPGSINYSQFYLRSWDRIWFEKEPWFVTSQWFFGSPYILEDDHYPGLFYLGN